MKAYIAIMQDEWDNLDMIGMFGSLDDVADCINENYIKEPEYHIGKGIITEYASTFTTCFDRCIGDAILCSHPEIDDYEFDDINYMQLYLRGFIVDTDCMRVEIDRLEKENE